MDIATLVLFPVSLGPAGSAVVRSFVRGMPLRKREREREREREQLYRSGRGGFFLLDLQEQENRGILENVVCRVVGLYYLLGVANGE